MSHPRLSPEPGPFRTDQVRDGDRYELSQGHPIYCPPMSPVDAVLNLVGAEIIASDPDVAWAGVDAGFCPEPWHPARPRCGRRRPGGCQP